MQKFDFTHIFLLLLCVIFRNDGAKQVGPLKADQLNNEAFSYVPMDTDILYADLIHKLRAMGKKINATLIYRQECFDSDDEDCTRNYFASCEGHPDFDDDFSSGSVSGSGCEPGSGSGSGSGCGSGSNNARLPSGFEDMEDSTVHPEGIIDEEVIPDFNRPNAGGLFRDQMSGKTTTPDETEFTSETEKTTNKPQTETTRNSDVSMGTMTIISTEDEDDESDIIIVDSDTDDDATKTNFDVTKDDTSSRENTDDEIDNTPVKDDKDATTDVDYKFKTEKERTRTLFSGSQSEHRLTLIPVLYSLLLLTAAYLVI